MWLIQKALGKTSKKATYNRRRIYVWISMFLFLLTIYSTINHLTGNSTIANSARSYINSAIYWSLFFLSGTMKIDGNRPYLYSLWEAYDPSYVKPKKKLPPLGTNKN